MKNFCFALIAAATVAGLADAGPFRRRATTVTCVGTNCPAPAQKTTTQVKGDTSTATNAALLIVQTGRFRHWGHPAGLYEGIGMAGTQQGAIQNCCFWGRRTPVDIGTAQMSNGMWVAVVRYR